MTNNNITTEDYSISLTQKQHNNTEITALLDEEKVVLFAL